MKVLIKTWGELVSEFGTNSYGDINTFYIFLKQMKYICGEFCEIVEEESDHYIVRYGDDALTWIVGKEATKKPTIKDFVINYLEDFDRCQKNEKIWLYEIGLDYNVDDGGNIIYGWNDDIIEIYRAIDTILELDATYKYKLKEKRKGENI